MLLKDYPEWELKPRKLTSDEIKNPLLVIDDLFHYGHLPEIRECLWDWLKATVTGGYSKGLSRREQDNMVFFYEHVERLIESVHIISDSHRQKTLRKGFPEWVGDLFRRDFNKVRPRTEDALLNKVLEVIQGCAAIEKIYHARKMPIAAPGSAFDLVVIIEDHEARPLPEYESLMENRCLSIAPVNIAVYKFKQAIRALSDGVIFFSKACTPENLVLDNGTQNLSLGKEKMSEDVSGKATEQFKKWSQKSARFLAQAKQYMEIGESALAVFLLHQALEFSLQAILNPIYGLRMTTHNLNKLLRYGSRLSAELSTLLPRDSEEDKRLFGLLQKAYVQSRYDLDYTISEPDVKLLWDKIDHLQANIERVFENILSKWAK